MRVLRSFVLKANPALDMAKASTIFPSEDDPGAKAKEIRTWLANKGVRDFEPVTLLCDQLDKVCLSPRYPSCKQDADDPRRV